MYTKCRDYIFVVLNIKKNTNYIYQFIYLFICQ